MKIHSVDPEQVSDYPVDWTPRLEPGETIVASTWAVPIGLVEGPNPRVSEGPLTAIWLRSGALETLYEVTNHVVTSAGREYDHTFGIYIKSS